VGEGSLFSHTRSLTSHIEKQCSPVPLCLFLPSGLFKSFPIWCLGPIPGHGLPYGALRSQSLDIPHSVGLLLMGDQPDAETCTCQHTAFTTDRPPCRRRESNPQSQQAIGSLRPRGYWDLLINLSLSYISICRSIKLNVITHRPRHIYYHPYSVRCKPKNILVVYM
jgi:hypothetical protein